MALVTLQRSSTLNAASSASTTTADAGEDLGSETDQKNNQSLSESFFMVKGAALFLQQGSSAEDPETPCHHKHAGDLPEHLQNMIKILRSEDHIKLAVRLESGWSDRIRYMVVVYTSGHQDTEENILLGMELDGDSKSCSVGLVLPLWSDANIHLDGDGGFSVNTAGRTHVFKPVSVQAMWSALQILHKACEVSRRCNYFPGGIALTWTGFYESCITSEQSCVNEWNAMSDLESRPETPSMFMDRPTERERTESLIRAKLRGIVKFQDLENVTSKEIRNELEQHMSCSLTEYKEFIDNELLLILGQMDKPTLIFDHLYLGSEWNASNLEELRECGVGYILNVTREIDNFFPGIFSYHNVRVFEEDTSDLLAYWNESYNFIAKAKKSHSKCLVHCKMGVSRSASTVIAYAMKEYGWSLEKAYSFVKQKRSVVQPNTSFMRQLAEYECILDASNQRHSRLWRPGADEDAPDELSGRRCCPGLGGGRGEEEEEEEEEDEEGWGACGASSSPRPRRRRRGNRCGGGPEVEPLDPLNYNYYFRRLSDSALDSEPSTPVRGPPLLGMERVFIEIEDVERDALLEDAPLPPPPPPSATGHLALPPGAAAQTCCRGDPLEDMRQRLEFSTLEEEDEEEAKKEEEEMAALALGGGGAGRREAGRLGLANLNTNNSNRLAAKRSCPATFDDSASTRSPFKVKPSYQSCEDCRRLPQGRRCDRPAGGRTHRHHPSRHGGNIPTISIDPPGTHFASAPELSSGLEPGPATIISCSLGDPGALGGCPEAPSQMPFSPLGFEDTEEDMEENAQGEPALRAGAFTQLPSVPPHGEVEPSGGEVKQQRARHQGGRPPLGLDVGSGPVALAMDGRLP